MKRYNLYQQRSLFDQPNEPSLTFDIKRGQELADAGLSLAVESANKKEKKWSLLCWQLFIFWLRRKKRGEEFMIEDFRKYLYDYDLIAAPPSERAFGFISVRAKNQGWIKFVRTQKVKNQKAHCANAAVWTRVFYY